jgi:hypothetical protein
MPSLDSSVTNSMKLKSWFRNSSLVNPSTSVHFMFT